MTKTFALTIALTAVLAGFAAAPAQAATRAVDLSLTNFAQSCVEQGGVLADANPSFACHTAEIAVVCDFVSLNQAACTWPGIDNQIAVNRLIGMAEATSIGSASDAVAKKGGGGIDKLDLPLVWK